MSTAAHTTTFCPSRPCGIERRSPDGRALGASEVRSDESRIQAVRAALLAAVDAVTTEVALLTAVSLAGLGTAAVITAGTAAAVAGAIGMAAGEYGSVAGSAQEGRPLSAVRREALAAASSSFGAFLVGALTPLMAYVLAPESFKVLACVAAGAAVATVAGLASGTSGRRRVAVVRQLAVTAAAVVAAVAATTIGG
jgi:VIT1/CCC1 family predicted Fe2+/Mn2+ transporter